MTISKTELALLYFPNICSESARQSFRRRLNGHPALSKELKAAQYNKCCHILTPRQVDIIIKHLGEPLQIQRARYFDDLDKLEQQRRVS